MVPARVKQQLVRSHFLFLGYGLRDWNLRVMLHRLWQERNLEYRSWAVQLKPKPLDQNLWSRASVDVYDVPLGGYVADLMTRLPADEAVVAEG